MNINETTGEVIKRSIYEDIRKNFQNRALNWNGVWKVWSGNSPDWLGRVVPGWDSWKIQMYDKIPDSVKDTKRKEYSGRQGEVNQNISEESSLIHTTGNENNIRRSIRELNNAVATHFDLNEYTLTASYTKRILKSYKVVYIEYNTALDVLNKTIYWTDSYQTFTPTDSIKLYNDQNLTDFVGEHTIVSYNENPYKKFVIEWTGDRHYVNVEVSAVTGLPIENAGINTVYDKLYNNPKMTSNNSNGVIVSNAELGSNTYKLFNNDQSIVAFNRWIRGSQDKPIIVYFSIGEFLVLKQYIIRADNRRDNWESPCDWTLEASNDNKKWIVLDTKVNEDNNWKQNLTRTFNINNNTPYIYYRLVFTRCRITGGSGMELGGIKFTGYTSNISFEVNEPELIGNLTSTNVGNLGVKKYSELKTNPNDVYNGKQLMSNPSETSKTDYENIPDTIKANQHGVYTFDVNQNWKLNNEDIVRKSDYEQLNTLLKKIENCLKLRDKWFDNNQRCNLNCQVNCQNRCQVSCQRCNTKQCHDQKCGTH